MAALVCSPALPALASQVTIYGWSTKTKLKIKEFNAESGHPFVYI